jgi:hypothetical protein
VCLVTSLLPGFGAYAVPAATSPAAGTAPGTARVAAPDDRAPLQVSIDSLAPSTIPRHGDLTLTGQVTNRSDETWTDLKVYLLTSATPMTSGAELAEAARTEPTAPIGERLYRPGLYDEIGDLAPGSSRSYTLSVPRGRLKISGEPGAYWLGVHVLGGGPEGRDLVADGRARTFIPLMRPRDPGTTLSLVIPVRATVRRQPDGRLSQPERWAEMLSSEGRLGRLLDFSGTSLGTPLTWLVDPAVLDAAHTLATNNPPMDAGPTDTDERANVPPTPTGSPSNSASESASASASASATASAGETPGESPSEGGGSSGESTGATPSDGDQGDTAPPPPQTPRSPEAQEAEDWLDTFRRQSDQHSVLALPYGEVDTAALLSSGRADLFDQARDLSALTLRTYRVQADPALAPPSGFLPEAALDEIDPDTQLVLSDRALTGTGRTVAESEQGHRIVLVDTSASRGGPGPGPRYQTLAIRQRMLSEAAVHALGPDAGQPLVVSTPATWDPGAQWRIADFFAGMTQPWLRLVDVPTAALGSSRPYDGQLRYPRRQKRAELPSDTLQAGRRLVDTGNAYAALLSRNDMVDEFLAKTAMTQLSYRMRPRPDVAERRMRQTTDLVGSRMARIGIDAPPFVTMSSESGSFQITLVNGLDEPVTVGVRARVDDQGLTIHSPDPVSLGPGQRTAVLLRATSHGLGVHEVTLHPVNVNGTPLGASTEFPLRSSQVGLVIWVILGLGAAVFVVAFAIRIRRRVRSRRGVRRSAGGAAEAVADSPRGDRP